MAAKSCLWVKNFIEITLSSTVFKIQAFFLFCIFYNKFKMAAIFANEIFVETWKG